MQTMGEKGYNFHFVYTLTFLHTLVSGRSEAQCEAGTRTAVSPSIMHAGHPWRGAGVERLRCIQAQGCACSTGDCQQCEMSQIQLRVLTHVCTRRSFLLQQPSVDILYALQCEQLLALFFTLAHTLGAGAVECLPQSQLRCTSSLPCT